MENQKNEDGTDKLDEQGNPIPVKVITDEEKEAAKVKDGLVDEIKDLRLKLGVTQGLLDAKEEPPIIEPKKELTEDDKITLAVEKALKVKDASNAQANKTAAFEKFVTDNKEFSPENDPTGLKRDALQKKVNQFNTDELTSISEFITVIRDAKTLLMGNDKPLETPKEENPYPNSNPSNVNPDGKKPEVLSPKELKLAQQTGRTKEQILKIKLKDQDFLDSLTEHVRD